MTLWMLIAGTSSLLADDWVLFESKYNAWHYTDHLYLEVFIADLDGGNTYCKEGTLVATNGSKSIDLLTLKYINQGDDESQTAEVKAALKMKNAKAWFTNSQTGDQELTSSEKSFWLTKWGDDHHYMTTKINLYYSSEMAGGSWKIYFHFKHSNNSWYDKTLAWVTTSSTLGLSDYNAGGYKVERSGLDKMTLTIPKLPNDIDSKYSSIRMRKATFNIRYTFYKQDGGTMTVDKTYEASSSDQTQECTFPEGLGNPKRIDYNLTVVHGVKDPANWFNKKTKTVEAENTFEMVPVPGEITTDFHQFDKQAVLAWTTPSGGNYMRVTPYVYRIETDEAGSPKSGSSWNKRGTVSSTTGGSLHFTDDNVTIGTYYKYMAVNVPTDWIDHGINESTLNNPSEDLLSKLGCSYSEVMNTAPTMSIYDLQQDTAFTDKVRLTWRYSRVPTEDATVNFKVLRKISKDGDWSEYGSVSGDAEPEAGTTLAFEDSDLPNSTARYQYKIRLEVKGYRFESDAIYAGLLSGTALKSFTATKGTHDASVTLSWNAKQVGTANSNYVISRRYVNSTGEFMQIYTTNGSDANYSYEDNTVKPGYYYEYKIEVYEGGVLQNTLYTVGFCQSRGTIAGIVNYGSGTSVPGVRMWLRPSAADDDNKIESHSQYVHGASEGILWDGDAVEQGKIFGEGKDYTVQFFVRLDEGLSEGAVLADIPGVGLVTLANKTTEGYELRCETQKEPVTTDLSTLTDAYTAQDGEVLTGTLGGNYKISIADGATVVLRDATINGTNGTNYQWAGITCKGDATIVLEGENRVKGFMDEYPGILIPKDKTLTIRGLGSLTALTSNGWGPAGIGGGYQIPCGNIVIEGGIITATGGEHATGVGGGRNTSCGTITITGGKVTATGGEGVAAIGRGTYGSCGTITIGGTVLWDGSNYQNGGESIIALNSYTYDEGDDWMSQQTPYETVHPTGAFLPAGKYSLLTISKTGHQMSLQVDTNEVKTITVDDQDILSPFAIGGMRGIAPERAFKGNFAEVRVWNHCLSDTEKKNYLDRVLNGRESGLMLYWPLDEGLERYAFDASYANDLPNGRHATVGSNITPSSIVPAEEQLSRYGMTNENGEYLIRGIPFMGSGSSYTLVPEKGIHRFNPDMRSLFISPTSLTANNIDFEDVSSFPMTGHIYYAGTNIPAEGIQLYVDGTLLTANGKVQQTDEDGYYSISVPIGEHYVEAKLGDTHKMVDGGRFPITGTHNFVDRVRHDFSDSTLVNFVGRVSGAKYNDTLPVGFAASHNNIGVATITLKLNNESFSFNCADDYISPATENRSFESDTASIQSKTWTGYGAGSRYIYITTDSLTGEFSAKLPPLKYVMQSVVVNNNPDVEFGSLSEVDLTNPGQTKTDSIRKVTELGDTIDLGYSYNTKQVMTYFASPQVKVVERKHPEGAFGMNTLVVPIDETHNDTINDIWTVNEAGEVNNMFGYPIYFMGRRMEYDLHGFEAYTNYDGQTPVTDTVAMNGQELTISNEMSAEQYVIYKVPEDSTRYKPGQIYELRQNTVTLDADGRATLPWIAGAPNIVSPFTRQFTITLKRDDRTYEAFRMDAIVLGSLTTGNNFVTKGPDNVQFILRDPYGAHSKTTLKRGKVNTITHYDTYERYGEHSLVSTILGGVDITVAQGFGVMMLTGNQVSRNTDIGYSAKWEYTHRYDSIYETTSIESISTGDQMPYVGAKGDVYVGTAKNLLVGTCRKVHAKKDEITGKYAIVLEDALALGEEINTLFAYSQYELENVMIPKWKDQRKQYLTQVASRQVAESYVNNGEHAKCLTWLSPEDPHYGDSATYVYVAPQIQPEETEIDSVQWCNNQIKAWQSYIAQNEEAKIDIMQRKEPTNYSIDGGTTRTFTERHDTTAIDQWKMNYKMGAVLGAKTGFQYNGAIAFGAIVEFKTNVGGGSEYGNGDDNKDYTEWEYVLKDGNRDVDLSINMYPSENGSNSKIFSLFGGQTYNPYEPCDSTHYYKPNGVALPLGNGTVRMEQPYVQIGAGSSAPGKSVTITDIPAGESATAVLYCSNMSNTNQALPFGYDVVVFESTDTTGLQILMDGVPINGRTIWTEQGTTVQKVITVQQTDQSVLNHEGIKLRFQSQYQPRLIYDEVTLNAHFMPSSSPVNLTVANPVVNTDPTTGNGVLQLKVSGFNRLFKNLKNIGVQYRFAGSTQWTNLHTWVTNAEEAVDAAHEILPATGDLKLTVDMSNNLSYPEGEYEFRAFSTTPYGSVEQVQVFSDVTKVVKDMTVPRPLYTPAPASGILGIGDQLSVEFNEDIVPGYVSDKNAIITVKLNGLPIDHEVSLRLNPYGDEVHTINPIFLTGNFSLEFWFNWHNKGTILHQGAGEGNFGIAIDNDGHIIVNVAGVSFTSEAVVPKNKWAFIALNYKAETMTFNMIAQYDDVTERLFVNTVVPQSEVQIVDYVEDNYLYLGRIDANIHDLALYNIFRDVFEAAGSKYDSKDSYTYGLADYWPMNEGHGFTAADTRHTHDFRVNDSWDIANTNYALRVDTTAGAQVDISRISTTYNDSYVIELWYYPSTKSDTVFQSDGLCLRGDGSGKLILDYGTKSQTVASNENFDDLFSGWHHFALNVVRGQAASFYYDGHRTAVIAEADMPVLKGARLAVGKGSMAYVDELRIWKATLSEERLLSNRYNTIDTSDVYARGLIAYYPFEKDSVINGVDTKGGTLENMAPKSDAGDVEITEAMMVEFAPPIKNAPREVRLTAAPVASERKVVINLPSTEVSPRELEGTTLNITLADIHDLHGNTSNPIKWTAYVQQNTLKWLKDSVNIYKKYGESYTFDVDIENKGGQIEYYTVANMPEWLTLVDSENSDDIKPLKTKTLRFAVNSLVPVNDYDITIGLQGNNEILEPLRIVMKVRGETPDWTVDPMLYDHNMTIIGQVYIGGILMENSESLVAAFIGGECRGVAAPSKVRGAAYITLSIYGHDVVNKDANKPISFRIWDASRGLAYTDARIALENKDTIIYFHQDSLIGNFDTPAIWNKSDKVEQLIPVHENWNWIAMGVEPETQYCDLLFADYSGWGILLKDRSTYIQSNGAEWKGNLVPTVNTMYKMKITRTPATVSAELNTQFSVRGQKPALEDIPVTLEPGWNWIAYTPLSTKGVKSALAGARPRPGDIIKSQTAVSIFGSGSWEGTLQSLESGHGYLYYSTENKVKSFRYPDDAFTVIYRANGTSLRALQRMTDLHWFTPEDQHNYPSNMTMTIRLLDGQTVVDTCELAAFIDGECRGAIRAGEEGLYYLVISGEGAGQAMSIRTMMDGEITTLDNTLTYISDDHVGTPWEPYVIQLNPTEDIETVGAGDGEANRPYKILEDNHVIIIRNGIRYDLTGKKLTR